MGDAGTAPETACMTPDQCFDEMAVALGVPKDTGYIDLLAMVKELKEENKKQKERAEKFRVRLCDRNQELVKALSPWKKEHQDHKRILEAIGELKQQNDNLEVEIKELKKVYDFGNSESDEEPDSP